MTHPPRLLVTMGPTHEPIDRVRFIGNRSSGRMGLAIATAAAMRNWTTTALVGPVDSTVVPVHSDIRVRRFQTTADLQTLLRQEWPGHDMLVMAAAVADYRPMPGTMPEKIQRGSAGLTLHLEPTPDLVAEAASSRRPDQLVVAFALEPLAQLEVAARRKMTRKGVDAIVANPLETMGHPDVCGRVLTPDGRELIPADGQPLRKEAFASWLIDVISTLRAARL